MYNIFIKRIIKLDIPNTTETPETLLKTAEEKLAKETIISDTFLIEDENKIIIAKEKVIYDTVGKVIRFENVY